MSYGDYIKLYILSCSNWGKIASISGEISAARGTPLLGVAPK